MELWLALAVVRKVVWVSTGMEDHGALRGPGTESMGALEGCDSILEVVGDLRIIQVYKYLVSCYEFMRKVSTLIISAIPKRDYSDH